MSKSEHRFHDVGDTMTCGECGREWCGLCEPTPGARCPFEYEHEDKQECSRCGDDVYTLSSDGLCDGCVAEETHVDVIAETVRKVGHWEENLRTNAEHYSQRAEPGDAVRAQQCRTRADDMRDILAMLTRGEFTNSNHEDRDR